MLKKLLLRFDVWAVLFLLFYIALATFLGHGIQCIFSDKCFFAGHFSYTGNIFENIVAFFVPIQMANIVLAIYTFLPGDLYKMPEVASLIATLFFIIAIIFLEKDLKKYQLSPFMKILLNLGVLFVMTFILNFVTTQSWIPFTNLMSLLKP